MKPRLLEPAFEEGIVPGGGVALIKATKAVVRLLETLTGDEKVGAEIIMRAGGMGGMM